jgi:hypothetical protein
MPQPPYVRRKQKKRRARKLADWRAKQEQAQAANDEKKPEKA